jgi:hypothetical protein
MIWLFALALQAAEPNPCALRIDMTLDRPLRKSPALDQAIVRYEGGTCRLASEDASTITFVLKLETDTYTPRNRKHARTRSNGSLLYDKKSGSFAFSTDLLKLDNRTPKAPG